MLLSVRLCLIFVYCRISNKIPSLSLSLICFNQFVSDLYLENISPFILGWPFMFCNFWIERETLVRILRIFWVGRILFFYNLSVFFIFSSSSIWCHFIEQSPTPEIVHSDSATREVNFIRSPQCATTIHQHGIYAKFIKTYGFENDENNI